MLTLLAADRDGATSSPLAQSLAAQTSRGWKLALIGEAAPATLEGRLERHASASDAVEAVTGSGNTTEGFVAIADLDDRLHPDAVEAFTAAFRAYPEAVAAFADSTEMVHGRQQPVLRPAWNPDLLRSTRYTGDPFVVTTTMLLAAGAAGWDPGLGEVHRYDLALRVSEQGGPVLHLGAALSHRDRPCPTDSAIAAVAVQAHLDRTGRPARASPGPRAGTVVCDPDFDDPPSASIIIPTAAAADPNGRPWIEHCLASLADTQWPDVETILVVGDECRRDLTALAAAATPPARVVRSPGGPFNFSTAVNCGALAARGRLLVLLNDDTEILDPSWLARLAVHASDDGVGAVGARLLYPDMTIQHIGIVFDDARPLHPFMGLTTTEAAQRGWGVARTVTAVTGACLMTRRREFLAVGSMGARLPIAYNDVDFCLRLARTGKRTVIEPAATLTHHESRTRRPHAELWEWHRFVGRWGDVVDPWYHPGYVRPRDPADPRRDVDHELPAEPPMNAEPRMAEVEPRVHVGAWGGLRGPGLSSNPTRLHLEQRGSTPVSVAPVTTSGIDVETVPDGEDPIDSNEPDRLRHEILRLRDGLGGANAVNAALMTRVAELGVQAVEMRNTLADYEKMTRFEKKVTRSVVRAMAAVSRLFRRP